MVPLADGSDLGGSLRNPASFCNVVGLRPSPGTVPDWPSIDPWESLSTEGPMGRCAADVALLLGAMAGAHPHVPLRSVSGPFVPLDRSLQGLRVGFSPTGGGLPVAAAVQRVLAGVPQRLSAHGMTVADEFPDLGGASDIFQSLRAVLFEANLGEVYDRLGDRRDTLLKDTVRWNVELARRLSAADVGRAVRGRGALQEGVRLFFERFDLIALPTVQVLPFPLDFDWVREIDGVLMSNYLEWMRSCTDITVTGCPAISVPFGFAPVGDGAGAGAGDSVEVPVGLQLVAAPGRELLLLQVAHALDGDGWLGRRAPIGTLPA
jgi:amidase